MRLVKILFMVLPLAVGLSGCMEYTQPLCSDDNLSDIPNIDGKRTTLLPGDDFQMNASSMDFEHVGLGKYNVKNESGESVLSFCLVGDMFVTETPTEFGTYKGYTVSPLLVGGFGGSELTVDRRSLDSTGIPYTIVNRSENSGFGKLFGKKFKTTFPGAQASLQEVIVVDNSDPVHMTAFKSAIVKNSISITFY